MNQSSTILNDPSIIIEFFNNPKTYVTVTNEVYRKIASGLFYKLVTVPKQHNVEDNLIGANGSYEVLNLISNCKAAIHTFNTTSEIIHAKKIDHFAYWLDQLEKPVFGRKIFRHSYTTKDRTIYHDPRTKKQITRARKPYTPLKNPKPIIKPQSLKKYWQDPEKFEETTEAIPIHAVVSEDKDRVRAKNSVFTNKTSHSLLQPDGRMIHFEPTSNAQSTFSIGTISNVEKLDLKGQR